MKVHDVVIVGAGPAGSALAIQLAASGYRVALLDRARFPRDKVCGDLVSARGLGRLLDLGCLEPLLDAKRTPIRAARVFLDGRLLSSGRMPELAGLPPHGYALPRMLLDEILLRRAEQAGAEIVEDCQVAGFDVDRRGVEVSAAVNGKCVRFRGRLIVGADGAQSVVAETAGLAMRDPRYVLPAVRAYCRDLPLEHAILFFEEDFFPGYGWIFPIADGVCNLGVGMVQQTMSRHRLSLKDFYRRLEKFVSQQRAGVRIERPAGWLIKAFGAGGRTYFERGLLIGEAGCFVDPLTGEGIPLALATAHIAGDTIEHAFARGEFGSASLKEFEQRWRKVYEADLRISDLLVATARNRDLRGVWMQALKVMAMTAARDESYALTLGGIMAGLVPARQGLSAEIILKSLLHGPAFWLETFAVRTHHLVSDTAECSRRLRDRVAGVLQGTARDPSWSVHWALEVLGKEFGLARTLVSASSVPVRRTKPAVSSSASRSTIRVVTQRSSPSARKAVVLGASGHIGSAVVRELLTRGWLVTAGSRRLELPANLAGLPVTLAPAVEGGWDARMDSWIAGQDLVVDAAAPYPVHLLSMGAGGRRRLLESVADRTEMLLAATRRYGASLAYIGSFVTSSRRGDAFSRARSHALRAMHPYFAVKQSIDERIKAEVRLGLPALTVNPTVCVGPWDLKPREHCLIPQLLCGEAPGLVNHEVNVIDVRDVARAVGAAVDARRWGEVIALSGHNVAIDALVRWICELGGGVAPPRIRLPMPVALCGTVSMEAVLNLAGQPSPSPALATLLVAESSWSSPGPEQQSLGVHPRALSASLVDAIDWYRRLDYC